MDEHGGKRVIEADPSECRQIVVVAGEILRGAIDGMSDSGNASPHTSSGGVGFKAMSASRRVRLTDGIGHGDLLPMHYRLLKQTVCAILCKHGEEMQMEMEKFKLLVCTTMAFLAGCRTPTPIPTADLYPKLVDVQADIKRQIGAYMTEVQWLKSQSGAKEIALWTGGKVSTLPTTVFSCGSGRIDFRISNVKAELSTSLDVNSSGKVGLTLPVLPITLGPSGGLSDDRLTAQTLDYNLWPLADDDQEFLTDTESSQQDLTNAPIAEALLELRSALILAASRVDETGKPRPSGPQPCFTDYNPATPAADAGNTFKLQLQISKDGNVGLSIGYPILSASGSIDRKSVSGNTLTVLFVQRDVQQVQILREQATKDCAFPYRDGESMDALPHPSAAALCVIATESLKLVTSPSSSAYQKQRTLENHTAQLCSMEQAEKTPHPVPKKPKVAPVPATIENPGVQSSSLCDQGNELARIAESVVQLAVGVK